MCLRFQAHCTVGGARLIGISSVVKDLSQLLSHSEGLWQKYEFM